MHFYHAKMRLEQVSAESKICTKSSNIQVFIPVDRCDYSYTLTDLCAKKKRKKKEKKRKKEKNVSSGARTQDPNTFGRRLRPLD
jgi:hypothetical protein